MTLPKTPKPEEKAVERKLVMLMAEKTLTMSINDFAKRWGIGSQSLRNIIKKNPDFPILKIGRKLAVIVDDGDLWVRRNLRA